ncbi:MAG TPA: chromosomal replication initiation protein, partial [Micromonosporaceae bacterium]|nr:chromosomal replication initiation protein [Micromonosporaceae bacterium]
MTDTSERLQDLGAVWATATEELADEIVSAQQRAYLRLTRLRAIVEDTALIAVPDAFTRDVIESRLRPAITDALSRRLGRPIQVAVTVRPSDDGPGGSTYPKSGGSSNGLVLGTPESVPRPVSPGAPVHSPPVHAPPVPPARDGDALFAMPEQHTLKPAPAMSSESGPGRMVLLAEPPG